MSNRPTMTRLARSLSLSLLCAAVALAGGCGDSGGRSGDAGGTDAAGDAGPGTDGGGMDAGGTDAGMDAGLDGGDTEDGSAAMDGAMDAGADAEPFDAAGLTGDGGILSCVGEALPATASDPLTVAGTVQEVSASGTSPIDGALLEVFEPPDSPTLIASTTSAADGSFSVSIDNPDETPVDAYLRATADGYKVTYLFPPYPLREDFGNALVGMVSETTFSALLLISGADHADGNGVVAVLVVDCFGDPLEGATVSSDPPAGDTAYSGAGGTPTVDRSSTAEDGLAYLFDLPPGDVEVDAEIGGVSMREHTVKAFADRITTTLVLP